MKLIGIVFLIAGSALAESLPNPDVIRMQQESAARESAIAHRIEVATRPAPARAKKVKAPRPAVVKADRISSRELRKALKEYVRTDHPMPIFWEPKQ